LSDDILVADFETTPNIGMFWRAGRKQTILPQSILKERQICVTGYRWLKDKKARTLTWGKDADEETMVRDAVALFDRARFIIMHNGDRFDLRWLRGRAMYYRIPMAPRYCTVDTLKIMQRMAYLNSHRLDYLGEYFGIGRKISTSYELWVKIVTKNHQPSLREMARYCRQDVDLLTEFYLEFHPWFPAPPNSVAAGVSGCPHCGSDRTVIRKEYRTTAGHDRVHIICRDCRHPHTVAKGRYEKARAQAEAV
jgi:DNA polymerase elongation subunit (family B)